MEGSPPTEERPTDNLGANPKCLQDRSAYAEEGVE